MKRSDIYTLADGLKKSMDVRTVEFDPDIKPDVNERYLREFIQDLKSKGRMNKRVQLISYVMWACNVGFLWIRHLSELLDKPFREYYPYINASWCRSFIAAAFRSR